MSVLLLVIVLLSARQLSLVRRVRALRRALEQSRQDRTSVDPLTGLATRASFREQVERTLAHHDDDRRVAVLFLDIDGFKEVNESLGHVAGDDLLIEVGERLRAGLSAADTVARLGADEFAILVANAESTRAVVALAEHLLDALRNPLVLAGNELFVHAGIGIAFAVSPTESAEELLRNADLALYSAKAKGPDCYEFFEPEMHAAALRRLEVEAQLRLALDNDELRVFYQPVVELETGHITGVEALVRWAHPWRGLLAPAHFVPTAESTGLIVPLGLWVLRRACTEVQAWNHAGARLTLSVNLSGRQLLDPDMTSHVATVLSETGLDPASLLLEITESVLMSDMEVVIARLGELRSLGVRFAIDDFGTGYSSLSYLRRFPVDVLKIDKSFVGTVHSDIHDAALVRAIVELGRNFALDVVAEGIETEDQAIALTELGCELGQGYLYARPEEAAVVARRVIPAGVMTPEPR